MNHFALRVFLDDHAPVAHLYRFHAEVIHKPQEIVQLLADKKGFEQRSAWVHHQSCVVVEFDFLLDVGRGNGGAKSEFEQIDFVRIHFQKVFSLSQAEAFVHDHGQAGFSGLGRSLREVRKVVVHRSGFHPCVAARHARVVEETWVSLKQPIHAFIIGQEQLVEQAQCLTVHAQGKQAYKLFVPQGS